MNKIEDNDVVLEFKDRVLTLKLKDFGTELDTEYLLQVDYNNIMGDIITFPVIFNRIAIIKAEIDSLYEEAKLAFDIFAATKEEAIRKKMTHTVEGPKDTQKIVKPTEGQIANTLRMDVQYREEKMKVISVLKQMKIVDGLYWAAKSKDKKLDTVSAKIKPEEFEKEILEGEINSVLIRNRKSLFN